ncbi:IreB family regulatory phosphoprotein [Alkalibacter mobilis]|uniref:IreB family regulatory phosphoprotein n=1 Tax=Alkalibacter mobilis TaxID=2787712 RepID=UPI0018A013B9|nr:IreB family regulatory phosphoprotein [Alkalibacter mobilis]MBF7095774.1 IreB family regulatory phosphoprotein [Alkalibacter mobilis]
MDQNKDFTVKFDIEDDKSQQIKDLVKEVYNALTEKGYKPVNQLVGYIMSGDPTYITSYNNARNLIKKVERDELLEELVKNYFDHLD